jgi:hypothetical protein
MTLIEVAVIAAKARDESPGSGLPRRARRAMGTAKRKAGSDSLLSQLTILRLAFRGGKARPKPGPYRGPRYRGSGEEQAPDLPRAA